MQDQQHGGRTALVFPGQGSHRDGMGAEVGRGWPELLDVLRDEVEGDAFNDAAESSAAAQPAIVATSLARWQALGRPTPDATAGHSLGELTALVAAGSLAPEDAVRLAARRGALMQQAIDEHPGCGMLAVKAAADDVADVAAEHGLAVANDNGPRQVILSGGADELESARAALKAERIRATPLPVAGAFHSPLMESAVAPFAAELARTAFGPLACPVISGVTAAPMEDPRDALAAAITGPVRWVETVEAMADLGVTTFIEVGPGDVLTGLIQRSGREGRFARTADVPTVA
jgi:[acyl-carrier-protein] S-malonyltransferase